MNQDGGTTEQSSDYETSDANTSSLNNSLSEEEFSIESSNIDSGGLKLTISCRKRSCEDEHDNSAGAHLNQQKDHSRSRAKHLNMEKEISEMNCTNEDYLQNSDSHKELPKSGHSYSDHPSYNEGGRFFMAPTMSPSRSSKGSQQKAPSSNECQNSALFVSTQSDSSTVVFKSGTQLEVSKSSDVLKGFKRFKQEGSISISSLHDSHEPLLRLDTLPNVSPDSGIISLDESPFGSESPNSFVNGDCSAELQHGPQSSFTSTSHHLHRRTVTIDDTMKQNSLVEEGKEHNGNEHSTGELSEQEGAKATAVDLTKELTKIAPSKESDMDCCTDEDVVSSPVIANGSGVILSSPHKISQTMGRKKRGRPPKQKKSLLLRHKRSTIYSGLYGAIPIVPHADYKSPSSADIHGGSFKKVSDILSGKPGQATEIVKSADIEEVNDVSCDNTSFKKRSPGRPKGSVSKKSTNTDVFRHAYKNVSLKSKTVNLKVKNNIGSKFKKDVAKRPRGRPRKNLVPTDSHSHCTLDNSDCHKVNSKFLVNDDTIVNNKSVRKKHFRKRVFTQKKRKPHIFKTSNNVPNQIIQKAISNPVAVDKNKMNSAGSLKLELSVPDSSPDKRIYHGGLKAKPHASPEKSVFQDNDLDALLKSVKSSITSQFTTEDPGSDIIGNISFVNPFKVSEPSPFPKMTRPESPKVVKPKSKKPKLHVMMRRTKRKKRKKLPANKVVPPTPPPPKKLNVFSTVEPLKKIGKFSVVPQKKTGTFGSPTSEKRLSFFTSCVQPSKILATSRLNVFRSGTGVDEAHRSGTPTDTDQPDCFDKRGKRRHRLLYRKSKHKNIIDPVFAADLDTLVSGLNGMFLSENPADNYIRVRPGEMPLPSIFRVIKIDVNKKTKDRILASETSVLDRNKPRKETPSPYDSPAASFKPISKVGGRKKSFSDQVGDQRELSSISDSSDQWLPPKKRHRLVNLDSTQFSSPLNYFNDSTSLKKDLKIQRKGKRLRKTLCNEDNKYGKLFSI
ncbi:unnamed protein product [Lymnaea stagnalis]|uniref:Uncharacterized protein n=1 Tax=Lymnaea stagnalis TaxID=6523 RepID=A0AAV2I8Z7_LYMST